MHFQNIHNVPLLLVILSSEMVVGVQQFQKATTPNGTFTCSTDTPSSVVSLDASTQGSSCISPGAQCSMQCRQLPKCTSFNYKKKTRTCEFFNFNPQSCSFQNGCTFYQISGQQNCPSSGTTLQAIRTTTMKLPTTTRFAAPTTTKSQMQADNTFLSEATVEAELQTTGAADSPQATADSGGKATVDSGGKATANTGDQATVDSGGEATTASGAQATVASNLQASDVSIVSNPSVALTTAVTPLVCSSNQSTGQMYLGQYVKLICTYNNIGAETPVITWKDSKGTNVSNATTATVGNQLISYIEIPGYFPSVGSFGCDAQLSGSNYNCFTSAITVVCPSGFDYVSSASSCYKVILESIDWSGAQQACQQAGNGASYSAMITSDVEQLAITSYLKGYFNQSGSACMDSLQSVKMVWTCGQLQATNNCNKPMEWKPATGVTYPLNYTKWASGEPSCKTPPEANIAIYDNADCSWGDRLATDTACSFCEYGPY